MYDEEILLRTENTPRDLIGLSNIRSCVFPDDCRRPIEYTLINQRHSVFPVFYHSKYEVTFATPLYRKQSYTATILS
jgi:hypothetical protein